MLPADIIEYQTLRSYNQGSTPTCSAHAFFVCLQEVIQNRYDSDIEFDFFAEYDRMKEYKNGRRGPYVQYYMELGVKEGFVTKDGKFMVKIKSYRDIPLHHINAIMHNLQAIGPLIFGVRRYKGHSLKKINEETGAIYEVKEDAQPKKTGHVMMIRGMDRVKKQFLFQNSWGESSSQRYMTFETFEKIAKYAYSIRTIEVTEL